MTDEALVDAATRRSDRRWVLCLIGLTRLADGDRAGAAAQFSALEEPGNCLRFFSGDAVWLPLWAEVWLQRLCADPTWPSWIPVKDSVTSRPKTQGGPGGNGRAETP